MFSSAPAATLGRIHALTAYMERSVMTPAVGEGGTFICASECECRQSALGNEFHEGQLSHVGEHYDLYENGSAVRVVIVGQEYGSQAERIGLATRRHEILTEYGRNRHYYKVDGFQGRNPHMRGTTSALRLLFGRGVGEERDGEFLDLASGERVHLFDSFALVNALLCGAHRPGTVTGSSTRVMQKNCQRHFSETLRVLEPTVIVLQGRGVARWTKDLFETTEPFTDHAERVKFAGRDVYLCRFSHPTARGALRWGDRLDAPYLREVVEPTLRLIRRRLLA